MSFFYVYILQSQSSTEHFYTRPHRRPPRAPEKHNAGEVPHAAKFRPWQIKTAIAFTDEQRAVEFEHYLKSGSGRAFAKKHL